MGKGFNAVTVQNALNDIQTDYNQLFKEGVSAYQDSAIKRICDNWQSDLAVKQVTQLVNALNAALDTITTNLKGFFPAVNNAATKISDSEYAGYVPVDFVPSDELFSNTAVATTEDGSVNCNRKKVDTGFENLDKFLVNRLRKNMDDFEQRAYDLAKGFDYDDTGEKFRDQLIKFANSVESFAKEIQTKVSEFHAAFNDWADTNNFAITESAEDIGEFMADTGSLSNFGWDVK